MNAVRFRDRSEAGRALGAELERRKINSDVVVLGLPRGGVTVAAEVAKWLRAPLDIVVVRKLGVPWHTELAMGALAGNTQLVDYDTVRQLQVSDEELRQVVARESRELRRREELYRGQSPEPKLKGKTVVLVDDGLATGSTMLAAVRHVRTKNPRKIIVATPVASTEARKLVRKEADECICLFAPSPFSAVGEWYVDFRQTTDEEVCQQLGESLPHPSS